MTGWTLNPEYATGVSGEAFADLDRVFALEGEQITSDPISTVHKVWVGGAIITSSAIPARARICAAI